MSIFAGGATLEAAADTPVVLDTLTDLFQHNLVRQQAQADGTPRFEMLETMRDFGLQQLNVLRITS